MLRFSLGGLLAFIVFAALGCAALVNANPLWAQAAFTFTVGAILLAIVWALFGPVRQRPVTGGFAICALAYFLLVNLPATSGLRPMLLTSQSLALLQQQLPQQSDVQAGAANTILYAENLTFTGAMGNSFYTSAFPAPTVFASSVFARHFEVVGHCLWTLILGLAGSAAARLFDRLRDDRLERTGGGETS